VSRLWITCSAAWPPFRTIEGIFLAQTRRLHPEICRFISDAVYDSRLTSHDSARGQALVLTEGLDDPALAEAGLRFVEVAHQGCAQRSVEEGQRLKATYEALLGCKWVNQKGELAPISAKDILVVSPYNMQVELLRGLLPAGARVGTVDKFQGQEAAVVLISMATSSGDDLPRQIEFLYSRNRLNVAVSRARCLAVIFANPRLLEIACGTIEQMQLVNTLCWAKLYAS
jgi:superfamily I DNA and/or RNA helicase